jgi:hypothetical protein
MADMNRMGGDMNSGKTCIQGQGRCVDSIGRRGCQPAVISNCVRSDG